MHPKRKITSAFFITFSGDCKKALSLYQDCFGGKLYFDPFIRPLSGIAQPPIVSGSLVSEKIVIYGSDLVHNEGRKTGNFMSVYIHCESEGQRLEYIKKLVPQKQDPQQYPNEKLIEITDVFEVCWVFGI